MIDTLIIGASTNPKRYSCKAAKALSSNGKDFYLYGRKSGEVDGVEIKQELPTDKVDTVTMYVRSEISNELSNQLLEMKPRRVIFNPGAENQELSARLSEAGIEVEEACTLVLLQLGKY